MSHLHTFLFTDLENSTSLWEQFPDEMRPALARHDAILKRAMAFWLPLIILPTASTPPSPASAVCAPRPGPNNLLI
jgi:hypothetical protein